MEAVHNEEDLYKSFKDYWNQIAYLILKFYWFHHKNLISDKKDQVDFKNALILEKMVLMICFYMNLNKWFEKELVFIKKNLLFSYSNLFVFVCHVFQNISSGFLQKVI